MQIFGKLDSSTHSFILASLHHDAAPHEDRAAHGGGLGMGHRGHHAAMAFLLWILAVILVIAGIVALFRRKILWGIVLIVVGLLVGPGGVSVFV